MLILISEKSTIKSIEILLKKINEEKTDQKTFIYLLIGLFMNTIINIAKDIKTDILIL